ncbi:MAG: hypothetical protein NVS1B1_11380 [Candidatus Limnocylindrales bacterium]
MRTSILLLLCSLLLGSGCGQAGASSSSASIPVRAAATGPVLEAELTLDVLELI